MWNLLPVYDNACLSRGIQNIVYYSYGHTILSKHLDTNQNYIQNALLNISYRVYLR